MDFSAWSPSHTILVIVVVVGFIGQVAVLFYRASQLEKRMDKQNDALRQQGETFFHAIERLEDRIDKRFVEVNQRLSEVRTEIGEVRTEIGEVRTEISKLNQNHIEHLTHHE